MRWSGRTLLRHVGILKSNSFAVINAREQIACCLSKWMANHPSVKRKMLGTRVSVHNALAEQSILARQRRQELTSILLITNNYICFYSQTTSYVATSLWRWKEVSRAKVMDVELYLV